ncbi:hypothetical protein N0V90_010899 [Kalmusia sp. IMI 367209]|nr:hypothetical protein N0V90_010899 [Kalmusia sp. IMI 367209]
MAYENTGDTYVGTGWLIKHDILVTAGHNVYDRKDGHAVSVTAWIGYHGETSVKNKSVQCRSGIRVMMPAEMERESETRDFAFVLLNEDFVDVEPFEYKSTPTTPTEVRVVGYPGDNLDLRNHDCDRREARENDCMYEGHGKTWKVDKSGFLKYSISTFEGRKFRKSRPPTGNENRDWDTSRHVAQ